MADDARDPLIDAYYKARSASEADAAAWAARFAADPADMPSRAAWLGWNMERDLHGFLRSAGYAEQILWLVANHPGSQLTGLVGAFSAGDEGRALHDELRRLWSVAVEREPKNLAILNHAAHFFSLSDPDRSCELLQAAQALAPADPLKEQALAAHWLRRSRRRLRTFDQAPFRLENGFDAEIARRALDHAERAMQLAGSEQLNWWYEQTRIEAAAAAGSWARAEELASAALARSGSESAGRANAELLFHANRILGHAALRRDDVSSAKGLLLECASAGATLRSGSFAPHWSLARELLELGERDAVLDFVRRIRPNWLGHDAELDLWELQIQRGEPCTFGEPRFRMSPLPPAEIAESDDRAPTERAYVAGLRASGVEASGWLEQTRVEPEDLSARAAWLGWASRNRESEGVLDEVRSQLEWLVQNKPEHPFSGVAALGFMRLSERGLRERLDELWHGHTKRPDVRPAVLGNAARYLASEDGPRALGLLARASELDPGNSAWPAQAAWVHFFRARRPGAGPRFDQQLDPQTCALALVEAERAHALAGEARPDQERLVVHMIVAAGAGKWERAAEIALEAVRRIPAAPILRVRKIYCLNRAHTILGLRALHRGDRDEARSQLRESVGCYAGRTGNFFQPNAVLALELLALGDRDAMLEFLDAARPLCPDEQAQIELWQKQVRDGRTPTFALQWNHL